MSQATRGMHIPVSVKTTFLLCQLLPCSPEAEPALQPLMWRFESWFSRMYSSPEECYIYIYIYIYTYLCSRTPVALVGNLSHPKELMRVPERFHITPRSDGTLCHTIAVNAYTHVCVYINIYIYIYICLQLYSCHDYMLYVLNEYAWPYQYIISTVLLAHIHTLCIFVGRCQAVEVGLVGK